MVNEMLVDKCTAVLCFETLEQTTCTRRAIETAQLRDRETKTSSPYSKIMSIEALHN